MKKVYETPTVELIAFRYRDQVVAASADNGTGTSDPVETPTQRINGWGDIACGIGEFVDRAFDYAGWNICE